MSCTDHLKESQWEVLEFLFHEMKAAKEKHKEFPKGSMPAMLLAMEELGEAAKAWNDRDSAGFETEMIHTMVVIFRYLEENFQKRAEMYDRFHEEMMTKG